MEFKVRIKKIHNSWNEIYKNEFSVGDEVMVRNGILESKNGRFFNISDLAKPFSNRGLYDDLFEKI